MESKKTTTGAIRLMTTGDLGVNQVGDHSSCSTLTGWRLREVVYRDRVEAVQTKQGGHNNQTGSWEPDQYEQRVLREPLFLLEQDRDDTIERLEQESQIQQGTLRDWRVKWDELEKKEQEAAGQVVKLQAELERYKERCRVNERTLAEEIGVKRKMEADLGTLRKQLGEQEWNKLLGRKS